MRCDHTQTSTTFIHTSVWQQSKDGDTCTMGNVYGQEHLRNSWLNEARVCMQLEIGTRPTSTDAHSSKGIGYRPSRASPTQGLKTPHWHLLASYTPMTMVRPKPLARKVLRVPRHADLQLLRLALLLFQIKLDRLQVGSRRVQQLVR